MMMVDSLLLVLSYVMTIAIVIFVITILVTIWEELRGIIKDGIAKLKEIHRNRKQGGGRNKQ